KIKYCVIILRVCCECRTYCRACVGVYVYDSRVLRCNSGSECPDYGAISYSPTGRPRGFGASRCPRRCANECVLCSSVRALDYSIKSYRLASPRPGCRSLGETLIMRMYSLAHVWVKIGV